MSLALTGQFRIVPQKCDLSVNDEVLGDRAKGCKRIDARLLPPASIAGLSGVAPGESTVAGLMGEVFVQQGHVLRPDLHSKGTQHGSRRRMSPRRFGWFDFPFKRDGRRSGLAGSGWEVGMCKAVTPAQISCPK
ncbi:hypothetical protein DYI23_08830 [Roseibium polysiphoniae]|uniref:Uncharacterized protein n=1 Tax=Roseibium polysiphoniae TaxID=2571221 RepID=A0A944GSH5_9HYPH|nr:hypothetical protein [Roseibium polysiphoniae]